MMMESSNGGVEKDFHIILTKGDHIFKIDIPVEIPFPETRILEFTQRILTVFDLPIIFEDVEDKLKEFVRRENFGFLSSETNVEESKLEANILELEKSFMHETLEFSPPEVVGDDEVFADAYHSLVHSPLLVSLLRKESALNSLIRESFRKKGNELAELRGRHYHELKSAVGQATQNGTTADTSALQRLHMEEEHMVTTRWESLIESEKASQKREFRSWVVHTYQDYYIENAEEQDAGGAGNSKKNMKKKLSVRFDDSLMISYRDETGAEGGSGEDSYIQESFTIHLGSQLKQTYNIRLLCCNPIMDFLRFKNESSREISPQRLQMAISLYSSDLSGIVLLTDTEPNVYNDDSVEKDLNELTNQTTDFHFESLETQLKFYNQNKIELKPGDFLLTRHSNLNAAHVVFHLVCNQGSLNRLDNINSRHPVILGLRNILKIACLNEVTTITVPALLAHEMTEGMTVGWCSRRAELVYKCVKGFMIEMASWGGAEMKNLQFVVPKDMPEEIFHALAAMLPNIFRVSNPLRLSSSSSSHSLQHQSSH
ncbi:protein C12orf4 isoform X2 [Folsomia candida]|uniref:protein C12orf4 isoform X2 n=1 Tax=Folsomia candida TaxID=158441 RepID=UPI000B8FC737|nr:protein C12orf4 isoform X2 [Folsomia candida]